MKDSSTKSAIYKISLGGLIAMIFPTLYGIGNPQQAYYQMGYASIIYMIIGAIFFFIPYSFMVSEMGSAFKDSEGGIFTWMKHSVGEKYSMVVSMIWYAAQLLWFVSVATTTWVTISTAIFGTDTTSTWHILGLNSGQTLAILGILLIIGLAIICGFGLKNITFLSTVALVSMIVIHIVVIGGAILVFAMSGAHFAQPMIHSVKGIFVGPNPTYSTPLEVIAFFVFIVFDYGGMEVIAGLADKVKNPHKNVPKGIIISTIIITGLMIGIVIFLGMYANWDKVLGGSNVNLANYAVYLTDNLGIKIGQSFGLNAATSASLGLWLNRVLSWSAAVGLAILPLRVFSPIQQLFRGVPKGVFPEKLIKENKHGVAMNAVWLQTAIVCFIVFLLGFTTSGSSSNLYNTVVLIMTVAMTVPYFFIVVTYLKFKKNKSIKKSYEFYSVKSGLFWGFIAAAILAFANIFAIIQPALSGDIKNSLWLAAGPVIFGFIGWVLYKRYQRKILDKQ